MDTNKLMAVISEACFHGDTAEVSAYALKLRNALRSGSPLPLRIEREQLARIMDVLSQLAYDDVVRGTGTANRILELVDCDE